MPYEQLKSTQGRGLVARLRQDDLRRIMNAHESVRDLLMRYVYSFLTYTSQVAVCECYRINFVDYEHALGFPPQVHSRQTPFD